MDIHILILEALLHLLLIVELLSIRFVTPAVTDLSRLLHLLQGQNSLLYAKLALQIWKCYSK
uniref:Uncharacterized protein n=1 Tax=Arundo donax TaxID=35708 RepID=A0A0A9DDZ0_ARUDO